MVDTREGLMVLGPDLPLLELPSRASLLSGRSVLQPPAPAETVDAVLRKARHDGARLRRSPLELADPQPETAQPLGGAFAACRCLRPRRVGHHRDTELPSLPLW